MEVIISFRGIVVVIIVGWDNIGIFRFEEIEENFLLMC